MTNIKSHITDFLSFLPKTETDQFYAWKNKSNSNVGAEHLLSNAAVDTFQYTDWHLSRIRQTAKVNKITVNVLIKALRNRQDGSSDYIFLAGEDLILFHDALIDRSAGSIVVITPTILTAFMEESFSDCRITPAQLRVLICFLAGLTLKEGALLDNRSPDTRKQQAAELRQNFGVDKNEDIVRIVSVQLAKSIAIMFGGHFKRDNAVFDAYFQKFLPRGSRKAVLMTEDGRPLRLLDIGPTSGTPIICLHPLILPDFRKQDLDYLEEQQIRLLWPLRNGQLAPADPTMSESDHIQHSIEMIELVRQFFCSEQALLLSFAASSKIALAYSKRHPKHLESVYFAASCVLDGRPQRGSRRLAKGIIGLLGQDSKIANFAMAYFCEKVLTRKRFPSFILSHFSDSLSDADVIQREISDGKDGERMRFALLNSVPSARHDFSFQGNLNWEFLRTLEISSYFLHGENDTIHPVALIRDLVKTFPRSTLHVLADAGQLLYYEKMHLLIDKIKEVRASGS